MLVTGQFTFRDQIGLETCLGDYAHFEILSRVEWDATSPSQPVAVLRAVMAKHLSSHRGTYARVAPLAPNSLERHRRPLAGVLEAFPVLRVEMALRCREQGLARFQPFESDQGPNRSFTGCSRFCLQPRWRSVAADAWQGFDGTEFMLECMAISLDLRLGR